MLWGVDVRLPGDRGTWTLSSAHCLLPTDGSQLHALREQRESLLAGINLALRCAKAAVT